MRFHGEDVRDDEGIELMRQDIADYFEAEREGLDYVIVFGRRVTKNDFDTWYRLRHEDLPDYIKTMIRICDALYPHAVGCYAY